MIFFFVQGVFLLSDVLFEYVYHEIGRSHWSWRSAKKSSNDCHRAVGLARLSSALNFLKWTLQGGYPGHRKRGYPLLGIFQYIFGILGALLQHNAISCTHIWISARYIKKCCLYPQYLCKRSARRHSSHCKWAMGSSRPAPPWFLPSPVEETVLDRWTSHREHVLPWATSCYVPLLPTSSHSQFRYCEVLNHLGSKNNIFMSLGSDIFLSSSSAYLF